MRAHFAQLPLIMAVLVIGPLSCGPSVDPKILTRFDSDEAATSLANYRRWQPSWKRGSWIVSLRDPERHLGAAPRLSFYAQASRQALLSGAFERAGNTPLSASAELAFSRVLEKNIELDLMVPEFKATASKTADQGAMPNETSLSFLSVSLRNPDEINDALTHILGLQKIGTGDVLESILPRGLLQERELQSALWQHHSLATLPGAQWVEPDLYSRLTQGPQALQDSVAPQTPNPYVPPEFEFPSAMADKLRLIKADLAYNFTGQGTQDRRPINVAVLDTGVDYKHPDLENQMWINSGEVPDNNQDDDGNGVVDDIHGFDATIPSNIKDGKAGSEPRPGAADLGGPGANCPAPLSGSPAARTNDDLKANCGHGTHVAGIIAAQHGADPYTLGVCPNCRIMSIRVAERCLQPETSAKKGECVLPTGPLREDQYEVDGNISDTAQLRALTYLFNTRSGNNRGTLAVNIVNMSLGKYFRSRSMGYLVQKLQESNVIVVAAAGNDDTDTPSFPAAYESVVAVCATSNESHRGTFGKAQFSNFGEWVDICAPGQDIVSTIPGKSPDGAGNRSDKDGTSQATPFVSGALGYLMSVSPIQRDAQQFIDILKKAANFNDLYFSKQNLISPTARDSAYLACYEDRSTCDYLLGTGFLNLFKAVNPAAPERFSDVDLNRKSLVSGQCVGSTIGSGQFSMLQFLSSMPLLLSHLPLFLWIRRYRRIRRPRRSRQNLEHGV